MAHTVMEILNKVTNNNVPITSSQKVYDRNNISIWKMSSHGVFTAVLSKVHKPGFAYESIRPLTFTENETSENG